MVITFAPLHAAVKVMHDRAGTPSSNTVHAPQTPCSQPKWVPVRSSFSRTKSARLVRGSAAICTARLFTVSAIILMPQPLGRHVSAHSPEYDDEPRLRRRPSPEWRPLHARRSALYSRWLPVHRTVLQRS